jgi:hypothetical protein
MQSVPYSNSPFLPFGSTGPSTPDASTTFARWSAAEAANGGLDAGGNWGSIGGTKTLASSGPAPFVYSATGLGGAPAIVSPNANSCLSLAGVSLPNASAAALIICQVSGAATQVSFEYGPNAGNTANTFANFFENAVVEAYVNISGNHSLLSTPQVTGPVAVVSRFYAAPRRATLTQNGVVGTDAISEPGSTGTDFGTQTLHVGSRANTNFFLVGPLAVVHLFTSAPDDALVSQWLTYYRTFYPIP